MECPACKLGLSRKESVIVSGYNSTTKEVINIRLPKTVYDRITIKSKPTLFKRIKLWVLKLFVDIDTSNTFTITKNGINYRVR